MCRLHRQNRRLEWSMAEKMSSSLQSCKELKVTSPIWTCKTRSSLWTRFFRPHQRRSLLKQWWSFTGKWPHWWPAPSCPTQRKNMFLTSGTIGWRSYAQKPCAISKTSLQFRSQTRIQNLLAPQEMRFQNWRHYNLLLQTGFYERFFFRRTQNY